MPSKTATTTKAAATTKTATTNNTKGTTMTTTSNAKTQPATSATEAPSFAAAQLHAALVCGPDICTNRVLGALWPNYPWLGVFRAYADKNADGGISFENATIFAGDLTKVWQVDIVEVFSRKSAPRDDVPHYTLNGVSRLLQAGWEWDDEAGRRISQALRAKAQKAEKAPAAAATPAPKAAGTKGAAGVDKGKTAKTTPAAPAKAPVKAQGKAPAKAQPAAPTKASSKAAKPAAGVDKGKTAAKAQPQAPAKAQPKAPAKGKAPVASGAWEKQGKNGIRKNTTQPVTPAKGKVIPMPTKKAAKKSA
jgi:hypothetical protein